LNNEIEIINGYGPSEATICSTFYKVNGRDAEDKYITIGKTIANNNIYILDVYKKLVPIGVVGEIYISGDSLGKGYLNNPKLTEEKFIDNPFNPGAKIYKTGDLAKWLPNGNIEFIGRADNQVKLRGFRIELSEIENILLKNDYVKKAIAVINTNNNGEKYIVQIDKVPL